VLCVFFCSGGHAVHDFGSGINWCMTSDWAVDCCCVCVFELVASNAQVNSQLCQSGSPVYKI
jgi:hypothetical protein